MPIFPGVLLGRGVKRQWGCRRRQFSAISVARVNANIII